MQWQPIDTAPKDGTAILSDEGVVKYYSRADAALGIESGWHLCDIHGWPHDLDADPVEPEAWAPIPATT